MHSCHFNSSMIVFAFLSFPHNCSWRHCIQVLLYQMELENYLFRNYFIERVSICHASSSHQRFYLWFESFRICTWWWRICWFHSWYTISGEYIILHTVYLFFFPKRIVCMWMFFNLKHPIHFIVFSSSNLSIIIS